jgi:hypothetical protein
MAPPAKQLPAPRLALRASLHPSLSPCRYSMARLSLLRRSLSRLIVCCRLAAYRAAQKAAAARLYGYKLCTAALHRWRVVVLRTKVVRNLALGKRYWLQHRALDALCAYAGQRRCDAAAAAAAAASEVTKACCVLTCFHCR